MTQRSTATAVVVTVLLLAVAAWFVTTRGWGTPSDPACRVVAGTQVYRLDREQVANAMIITDAARRTGLEHHAVTVALAAAIQESQLRNFDARRSRLAGTVPTTSVSRLGEPSADPGSPLRGNGVLPRARAR